MIKNKKVQSSIFTLDQIMDSGLVFIFIAVGGNLLSSTEMASVVVAQSISLVCVLFCSCFTTQYLLLRYKEQGHFFWLKLFFFFVLITVCVIVLWFKSILILSLFVVGIVSEFIKRYCYYADQALLSFCAMLCTVISFMSMIILAWGGAISLHTDNYIFFYSMAKFLPLMIVLGFLAFKRNINPCFSLKSSEGFSNVIQESLKLGGVFSIITIIYWMTNQGFFIIFQNEIPATELVNLRVTQNVFGIVTMLITLYDSIFLKNNINNTKKIFSLRGYLNFSLVALGLIVINFVIAYVFSKTLYMHIDIFKYSLYFALAQLCYLLARMPILILKLRYNLLFILALYIASLFISLGYLFLNKSDTDYQYIVQSTALANFLVLFFSLIIVFKKEVKYG